ncbi:MAG: MltA domain-containing protein [Alphaproteobacteria bacterium]|nr:MltA domain-containing protein [Alphaproteobacteria bacterium]
MRLSFPYFRSISLLGLCLCGLLAGCSSQKDQMELVESSYADLPGWDLDSHGHALPALVHTCKVIHKKNGATPMVAKADGTGSVHDWKPICHKLKAARFTTNKDVKQFIETHLKPYQILNNGKGEGTFTGYYIPVLKGSYRRHGPYQTPIYKKPPKNVNHRLSRAQIMAGALTGKRLEIMWVDDPIDAFFVEIQGTGKVIMDTGQEIRINVAGQNGFPYFPIGKALVDKGYLAKDNVSMQSIKAWLKSHPQQMKDILALNESYIYFDAKLWTGDVIGSHNTPLTAQRSLAVDRRYIPLGMPLWISAQHPYAHKAPLQQLMVAQDTGGAIKGPVRGDFYWGIGDYAADHAGRMNSKGQLFMLLPR